MHRRSTTLAAAAALATAACALGTPALAGSQGERQAPPTAAQTPRPVDRVAGVSGDVQLRHLARIDAVTSIAAPPGDRRRVFITQQDGLVWVLRSGRPLRTPFLDLRRSVLSTGGEEGLLSIAFHPGYARNRLFYVFYSNRRQDIAVVEYRRSRRDPERAEARGRRVLTLSHRRFLNHWGGQLQFGPDGYLYLTLGDGGSANNALRTGQNLASPLAKLWRIDPTPQPGKGYRIPPDNPFVGRPGATPETWMWGLRNPWRFSFDRLTGDLFLSDVGADGDDEVNFFRRGQGAGSNLGWCAYEGFARFCPDVQVDEDELVFPAFTSSGTEQCALIGGYAVRDPRLPGIYGRYLYGDFCKDGLRTVSLSEAGATADAELGLAVRLLTTFGEDSRQRIWLASRNDGLYRLEPRGTRDRR